MNRVHGVIAGLVVALTAGFSASPARAQGAIQKCVDASGKVSYQDRGCAEGKPAGQVERDTRQADPAALQRAKADLDRTAVAIESRAGISVTAEERKLIQPELQRYLAAVSRGDNEERCRIAGQISGGMRATNNDPAHQRWKLYQDNDCAAAREATRLAQAEAVAKARADAETRYTYVGNQQPAVVVVPVPARSGKGSAQGSGADLRPSAMLQSPAPCQTVLCRRARGE